MSPFHWCQYLLYSVCIQLFTMYTYVIYYSDLVSQSFRREINENYDYIIVGSGTAGSVIAQRLTKETNYTFLVLEAGCTPNALMAMPIVGPVLHRSLFDWQYETVPQEHACWALHDHKCRLPQGKILGGSSKLNNMIHFRGNLSHYVDWFYGKHSKEYIRQQFRFLESDIIHLDNIKYESHLSNAVMKAARELGYKEINTESELGFMKSRVSQKNGKRWSTSDNIESKDIVTNILVERIVLKGNKAIGVEFIKSNVRRILYAKKGVILSAGTYNSAKILQLSGIGPKKLLKSLNIPIVKDLPVGKNLQDHVTAGLDLLMFNKSLALHGSDIVNPINLYNYFLYGEGPLTTPGCEVIGFMSTKNEQTPDLQFMVLPAGISSDRGSRLRKNLGIKDDIWFEYFVKTFDKYTASIIPIVLHPRSKGTVFIRSKDAKEPPLIDPKYLSNEDDRQVLINGLKIVKEFSETNAMKNIGGYINPIPVPSCIGYAMFSDSYWNCYIKHLASTSYHPVGTCSMGLPDSGNAVVDNSFKVLGTKNLYVVDASVLPTLPSGNINAAVAMMASVFFDTNIVKNEARLNKDKICFQNDLVYKYLFNVCFVDDDKA